MAYKKLSDAEKKQLLKDVFGEKHSSVGQNFPFYSKLIDRLDKFNDIVAIAELLPGVNALASGPGISAFLSHASFVGLLFFPFTQIVNVINAKETGHKLYSYRCIAYTITAWSFGHPIPKKSATILKNIFSGNIVQRAGTDKEYNEVWQKTSQSVLRQLEKIVISKNIPKRNLQLIFRAIGNDDPNTLCLEIKKGFENKLSYSERLVWKSNYRVNYGK